MLNRQWNVWMPSMRRRTPEYFPRMLDNEFNYHVSSCTGSKVKWKMKEIRFHLWNIFQFEIILAEECDHQLALAQCWHCVTPSCHLVPTAATLQLQGDRTLDLSASSLHHRVTVMSPRKYYELQTKVKRRFAKISQSRRRPLLLGSYPGWNWDPDFIRDGGWFITIVS